MNLFCRIVIIVGTVLILPNIYAQSISVKNSHSIDSSEVDLNTKLTNLFKQTEDFGTEANQRLTAVEKEFKNRSICESNQALYRDNPADGTPQCYKPSNVEAMYLEFSCSKNPPDCKEGFIRQNAGVTTKTSGMKGGWPTPINKYKCGTYCSKKIKYIGCVWRKAKFRHYSFCVKKSSAQVCTPTLDSNSELQNCVEQTVDPCANGACDTVNDTDTSLDVNGINTNFNKIESYALIIDDWKNNRMGNDPATNPIDATVKTNINNGITDNLSNATLLIDAFTARRANAAAEDIPDIDNAIATLNTLKVNLTYMENNIDNIEDAIDLPPVLTNLNSAILYSLNILNQV